MLGGNCSPCCGGGYCDLPPMPDAIEVEIVSGESQYASAVVGMSPEGGTNVYKYATAAAWTIPSGVFVLEQYQQSPGVYVYENLNIGIDSLSVRMQTISATSSGIFLSAIFAIARQKTLVDTDTPPTEEEMLSDDWLGGVQLDDNHPPFSPTPFQPVTYIVPKATLGSGSAVVLRTSVGLLDYCNLGEVTRTAFANLSVAENSHSICLQPGCVFPGVVQANARSVNIPRGATIVTNVTSDLGYHRAFPWYMYLFSRAGTYPSVTYQARASGKATATIQSVTSIYGNARVPLFAPRGESTCSAFRGASLFEQENVNVLPQSIVPSEC